VVAAVASFPWTEMMPPTADTQVSNYKGDANMADYLNTFTFINKEDSETVLNPFTLVRLVNFDEDTKWTVEAVDVNALTANAVAVRTREIEKELENAQEANRLLAAWNDDKARKLNGALSEVRQFVIDNEVWRHLGGGQAFIDEMVEYGMEPLTKKYRFEVTCSFTAEGEVVVEMDASEHDIRVAIQEAVTQESFHLSDYDDGEVSVAFDDSYAGVEVDDTSMYEC
jgi:hypothetical protein